MDQFSLWVAIVVLWSVLTAIVNHLIGLEVRGWRRWVYDLPAFIAGILIGHYFS